MNNFLKHNYIVKILYSLITIYFFISLINTFDVDIYIFLLFSLSISILFLNSFNNNEIRYFQFFLSIFIWLGFFFKLYVCIKIIKIFPEGIGEFNFSKESYNEVLLVSSLGILGFFTGFLICPKIKITSVSFLYLEKFYNKHNISIKFLFVFLILFLCVFNLYFQIFQKGFVSNILFHNNVRNLIAYLLIMGFSICVAMIINYDLNKKKYGIIYLSLFETFLSSVSILSRAMIFNLFPFLIGYIVKISNRNIKINKYKVFYFFIIGIILTVISIIISSNIRSNQNIFTKIENQNRIVFLKSEKLYNHSIQTKDVSFTTFNVHNKKINDLSEIITKNLNNLYNLIVYRFIGIEGVMAVQSKKGKNLELFREAINEKYQENTLSFYDEKFLKNTSSYKHSLSKISNQHAITLPGFIAFSYYGNSKTLVFLFALIISILCNLIVQLFQNLLQNPVLSAFIANLLAYRLIHWGYAPLNSYKFIFALILSLILIILTNYVLKKFYYRK